MYFFGFNAIFVFILVGKTTGRAGTIPPDEVVVTIKCYLRSIIRDEYKEVISNTITARAMEATKICVMASLNLLTRIQVELDNFDATGNIDYFYIAADPVKNIIIMKLK